MRTPGPSLTPDQAAEAQRIFQTLREASEDEQWRIAQLLASKKDLQLLGETEYQVRDLVHQIGAKAIETALKERKKRGYRGSILSCPTCRESGKFVGYRSKTLVSLLGVIHIERAYYHCRHCQSGLVPWDQTLRLSSEALTPAAREVVSMAGVLPSFAEVATLSLPKLSGLRVSESTVQRTTEGCRGKDLRLRVARCHGGPAARPVWYQGRRSDDHGGDGLQPGS